MLVQDWHAVRANKILSGQSGRAKLCQGQEREKVAGLLVFTSKSKFNCSLRVSL